MGWNWGELLGLSFAVLLLGAAMIANVSESAMPKFVGLG
jgi:hypothetical protein